MELKQRYPGYEISQCNIILDVLRGWSKDLDATLQKLVGSKTKGVLKNMQKARLSGALFYCNNDNKNDNFDFLVSL